MAQKNIRIEEKTWNWLNELAKFNDSSAAEQLERILAAGFQSLEESSAAREIDAAHQVLTRLGIPDHKNGRRLAVSARIGWLREMFEQQILQAIAQDALDEQNECNHSLGENCPACVKQSNPDEPLDF